MSLPLSSPPKNICILRLSAIGDICHILPVVRTIQSVWPETHITWIIGKLEHSLVYDIPDIEFIIFDKSKGLSAYSQLRHILRKRHFDVLLHMQMSLRASIVSLFVPADIKLGFDRKRAKDLQWLFTNHQIKYREQQHVMDSFFEFIETLGISGRQLYWGIPISEHCLQYIRKLIPNEEPILLISPCSSMSYRNWNVAGYAEVADYAIEKHRMCVVLTGGSRLIETDYGRAICAQATHPIINLIGKTDLKQLLALLSMATILISPDAGPAHLATAVGLPVIGLYATTNPDRARPYLSADYVINHYPDALLDKYGKLPDQMPWGTRVRKQGTMNLILISEVRKTLDKLIQNLHMSKI